MVLGSSLLYILRSCGSSVGGNRRFYCRGIDVKVFGLFVLLLPVSLFYTYVYFLRYSCFGFFITSYPHSF